MIKCSACYKNKSEHQHPLLHVPICDECYNVYHDGTFDVEGGHEIYCRWCGEGRDTLFLCDTCEKCFCGSCITNNFGVAECIRLEQLKERWSCFLCSSQIIEDLRTKKGWTTTNQKLIIQKKVTMKYMLSEDISNGREKFEIPCINDVDNEGPPPEFIYVSCFVPGNNVTLSNNPNQLSCCNCKDNCKDSSNCECIKRSNGRAYDDAGLLIKEINSSDKIFECNQLCSCHKDRCRNRVVGKGPQIRLQVFRCANPEKGWGVRCLDTIPAGTFVADYVGEIITEEDADRRGLIRGDEYLFTLDDVSMRHAASVLDELGLRDSLLSRPEHLDVNFNTVTSDELQTYLGSEIFEKLKERGRLSMLKNIKNNENNISSSSSSNNNDNSNNLNNNKYSCIIDNNNNNNIDKNQNFYSEIDHISLSSLPTTTNKIITTTTSVTTNTITTTSNRNHTKKRPFRAVTSELRERINDRLKARDILYDKLTTEHENAMHMSYCIDAKWYGNVARFINHCCDPNLIKKTVYVDSRNALLSRLAFFARDEIPPLTELSYDYGYQEGNVRGKSKQCLCGATSCRNVWY